VDWGLVQIGADNALIRLRKDIHFSDPVYYIMAVALNGLLRLLKVESHLYHVHPFCVDLSEIVRRWTWVIFRFENEWIKRSYLDMERAAVGAGNGSLHLQSSNNNSAYQKGTMQLLDSDNDEKIPS
jgi:hypothetical protein